MNRLFLLPVLSLSLLGVAACGSPEPETRNRPENQPMIRER